MTPRRASILLIGGSSEIGLAIVGEVADPGARLFLAGRPTAALDDAAVRLRERGNTVSCLNYDAQWPAEQTARLLQHVAGIAPLDLVIVAVGSLRMHHCPTQVAEAGLEMLLRTNLVGPALVANEAADLLTQQRHGQLVVITSASAARPRGQILGYSIAKQALDSFVLGLDRRTRHHGVRCFVVRPGQVRTRMTAGLPNAMFTTGPDRVAARVRRALVRRSPIVWSPAAIRPATALLRLAPSWVVPEELR